MPDRYVVVGGGLAGIQAALRLADAGQQVTVVEARPRLGGAAFSFRRGGLSVDNGQHVFLRCCTAYRALLERIDATGLTSLQDRLDIPVLADGGRRARLSRSPHVPAPLHLGAALARFGLLSPADRVRAGRVVAALLLLDPADPELDRRSFGAFLRRHGQSPTAIERLWGIIGTATLNARADDASLALAVKVFRTGLLEHADAADVGHAIAPLGRLHHTAARDALDRAGVEVLLRHRAQDVRTGAVVVRSADGRDRTLTADGIVLAVPPEALDVAPGLAGTGARLGGSAIVNVHVVYDRQVTDLPFAAAVDSPVQWFFDRSDSSGLHGEQPRAQYLAVTVSAADAVIGTPSRQLVAEHTAALARLLPAAGKASVLDAFVTRERRATFRQAPGSAAHRRGPACGVPGLALAGAWTPTGWPDTMESAARSGVAAAEFLLAGGAAHDAADAPLGAVAGGGS